jgi:hypothetical protein
VITHADPEPAILQNPAKVWGSGLGVQMMKIRVWLKLDFTHLERALNAERQVCKLVPTLLPKEVRDADGACHSDAMDGKVCAAVF